MFFPFFVLTANEVLLCGYINAPGSLSLPSPTYMRHTHTHMLSSDVSIILAFLLSEAHCGLDDLIPLIDDVLIWQEG